MAADVPTSGALALTVLRCAAYADDADVEPDVHGQPHCLAKAEQRDERGAERYRHAHVGRRPGGGAWRQGVGGRPGR